MITDDYKRILRGGYVSYLKQFARNKSSRGRTEMLTARLPADLYADFKNYCDELGLSISEAVNLLVEQEISSVKAERIHGNTSDEIASTIELQESSEGIRDDVVVNTRRIQANNSGGFTTSRFTTNRWKVNGDLPCPICETWVSSGNFARHAKSHDKTTVEIFNEYSEKADQMVGERGQL